MAKQSLSPEQQDQRQRTRRQQQERDEEHIRFGYQGAAIGQDSEIAGVWATTGSP
jgi:hypothetical protein